MVTGTEEGVQESIRNTWKIAFLHVALEGMELVDILISLLTGIGFRNFLRLEVISQDQLFFFHLFQSSHRVLQSLLQDSVGYLWIFNIFQAIIDDCLNRCHSFGQLLNTRQFTICQGIRFVETFCFFQKVLCVLRIVL